MKPEQQRQESWCKENSKDQRKSPKDKKARKASVTKTDRQEKQMRALTQKQTYSCGRTEKQN